MTQFIFEPINWSPFLGVESPDIPRIVRAAARAGYPCISFDTSLMAAYTRSGATLADLRRLVGDEGVSVPVVHSIAIGDDVAAAREQAFPLAEAASVLGARYVHVGGRSRSDRPSSRPRMQSPSPAPRRTQSWRSNSCPSCRSHRSPTPGR